MRVEERFVEADVRPLQQRHGGRCSGGDAVCLSSTDARHHNWPHNYLKFGGEWIMALTIASGQLAHAAQAKDASTIGGSISHYVGPAAFAGT